MYKSKTLFKEQSQDKHIALHDRLKEYSKTKIQKDEQLIKKKIEKLEKSIENHTLELEEKKETLLSLKADLAILSSIEKFI